MGYYGIIWYIIPLFKKKKKTRWSVSRILFLSLLRMWLLILNNCYQLLLASYHAWCRATLVKRQSLSWTCSQRGLHYHFCCQKRGRLLPYLFTLTKKIGGIFSVALSVSSRFPGVTWRPAL